MQHFTFLVVQGLLGLGGFTGGTLRLADPRDRARLRPRISSGSRGSRGRGGSACRRRSTSSFFRGVPLVMVIFWIWFIIPQLLPAPHPEYGVALTAFVIFEAAYFGEIVRAGIQSVPRGQVEAATALG